MTPHANYALARVERQGMRAVNQDCTRHVETGAALLLAVADGMGGHYRGELAAEIAVSSLAHSFSTEATPRLADPAGFIGRALLRAHLAIRRYTEAQSLPDAPRTVIVACVVQEGGVWWNHVGDARLYLVRDGRIEARTRDHTRVQALVDAGQLSETGAASHPERNQVLECLGGPYPPQLDAGGHARLQANDIVLLCSDGFWAPLTPAQLLRGLTTENPIGFALADLADLAERRAGAHADNLSVLALAWTSGGDDAAEPVRARATTRERRPS